MTSLRTTAAWIEGTLVFFVILIPPFLYGGLGALSTLIIQGVALVAFGFPVSRTLLSSSSDNTWFKKYYHVAVPLLAGVPFVIFIILQIFGGSSALLFHPGSLAPFATTDHLRQLLSYAMLFIVFFGFFNSRKRIDTGILLIAIQVVLLIAAGYLNAAPDPEKKRFVAGILDMANQPNYYSAFLNPNHFGGYIVLAQPLFFASVVYFLQTREGRFIITPDVICRIFFVLLIPMTMFSTFSAEARTAFFWQILLIASFVGCLVFRRPRLVLAAGVVCAGVVTYFIYTLPHLHIQRLSADYLDRARVAADTYKAFMDFPWFGAGLGACPYYLRYYQTVNPENFLLVHPYNHFVQLACETGIVGSVLFLFPVIGYLIFSYKLTQKSESRRRRIFGLAAFLALILSAAPALLDNYLATPASACLAIFYAALLGRCAVPADISATAFLPARRPSAGRLAVIAALWAGIFLAMTVLWSDYCVQKAITALSKDGRRLEEASRLRADNAEVWMNLGHWHYNEAVHALELGKDPKTELEQAVYAYYCAVVRTPSWAPSWIGLAKAQMLSSNLELASRYLSFGVGLTPRNRDMIIYGILMQLRFSQNTLWRDERELFERRAAYWVGVGSVLPRPLHSNDVYYLLNYAPHQLGDSQKKLVASFISRCYRIPSKRLTS